MNKFVAVGFFAAIGLSACGGGGSSIFSSDDNNQGGLPPERPTSSVSGYSVDALITGGIVKVYALDDEANKAELLGTGSTDETGYYEITLQTSSQPVLIEVTYGSYIEEASGVSVSLAGGDVLRVITFYESGSPLMTMVTPFTNLAAGIVKHKVDNGINLNNAISESVSAVSTIAGVDILRTYPRNITDPANATFQLTDEHLYGFLTAAQSHMTKKISEQNGVPVHSIYTSMNLSKVMYRDVVSDGELDGMGINSAGEAVQLALGVVKLDANMYRNILAQNMLSIAADTEINKTNLAVSDLLLPAQSIASNGHAMFSGNEAEPLDQDAPTIAFSEAEGVTKAGIFDFTITAADFIGVDSVEFFIDGESIGIAADPNAPSIPVNSLNYYDGEHILGVVAKDIIGNISEMSEFTINFDNNGVTAVVTSPLITNQAIYEISGSWHDEGVGVDSIVVDGKVATIDDDGTWFVSVTLDPGYNDIGIQTTDMLGNTKDSTVMVGLDQAPPEITPIYDTHVEYVVDGESIYVASFEFADSKTYPVRVYTDQLSANGAYACNYSNEGFTNIRFSGVDPYFYGVKTDQKALNYEIKYFRDGQTVYDWRLLPPCVEGSTSHPFALVTEYLDEEWHLFSKDTEHKIELRVTDEAGNSALFEHFFRVDVRVPNDAFVLNSVDGSSDINAATFATRSTLFNAEIDANTYELTNNSEHDIFVSIEDSGSHEVTNTVEWAQREHQYDKVSQVKWQARENATNSFTDCNWSWTGWFPIDVYYEWDANNAITTVELPAPTIEYSYSSVSSDTLPTNSQPTSWSDVGQPGSYSQTYRYSTYENAYYETWLGRGLNGEERLGDYLGYTPGYGGPRAISFRYKKTSDTSGCDTGFVSSLQERTEYSYVSSAGFPRTNTGSNEASSDYFLTNIEVIDSLGNSLSSIDGYYKFIAGERYFIKRSIDTPDIESFDNHSVANIGSFSNYSKKQYDKKIDWDIDRELAVNLVHAETPSNLYGLTHSRVVYEEGKKDVYTIAR